MEYNGWLKKYINPGEKPIRQTRFQRARDDLGNVSETIGYLNWYKKETLEGILEDFSKIGYTVWSPTNPGLLEFAGLNSSKIGIVSELTRAIVYDTKVNASVLCPVGYYFHITLDGESIMHVGLTKARGRGVLFFFQSITSTTTGRVQSTRNLNELKEWIGMSLHNNVRVYRAPLKGK